MLKFVKVLLVPLLVWTGSAMADTGATEGESGALDPMCVDTKLLSGNLITDICWDCVFPLRMAGVTLAQGDGNRPASSYDSPFCVCMDAHNVPAPGFSAGMWEPSFLVEHQKTPGCMGALNGTQINAFDKLFRGTHGTASGHIADKHFAHYHYYSFPLLSILDLFTSKACNPDGYLDIDLMFFSEIDPTWNLDELAFFTTPEAAIVSNPLAVTACTADAISSTAGQPIEEMFWCAGAWGHMYPLTGNVNGPSGMVEFTSLQKARVLNLLHRRGAARDTVGKENMCYPEVRVTLPKQNYKFTMVWPVAETKEAHVMGESVLTWGSGRMIPGVGEDPLYLIWRWKDCCLR